MYSLKSNLRYKKLKETINSCNFKHKFMETFCKKKCLNNICKKKHFYKI